MVGCVDALLMHDIAGLVAPAAFGAAAATYAGTVLPTQMTYKIAKLPARTVPLTVGRAVLDSWAWCNVAHGPHSENLWRDGAGIGVPEFFVGLPDSVCAFGIHAESRGCDFVNLLGYDSDPGVLSRFVALCCVAVPLLVMLVVSGIHDVPCRRSCGNPCLGSDLVIHPGHPAQQHAYGAASRLAAR